MSVILDLFLLTIITFIASYICLSFLTMSIGVKLLCCVLISVVISSIVKKNIIQKQHPTYKLQKICYIPYMARRRQSQGIAI